MVETLCRFLYRWNRRPAFQISTRFLERWAAEHKSENQMACSRHAAQLIPPQALKDQLYLFHLTSWERQKPTHSLLLAKP
jgi:hypothetical protein